MPHRGGCAGLILAAVLVAKGATALPAPGVALHDIGFPMRVLDLPSGMRVVFEEDHSQPLIAIIAIVDVGSFKDPAGKEGLAHLVEHLTFRAKPDGKSQRSNLLNLAAAGYWNASTNHELTTYVTIGPREALKQLLALEGGMLASPLVGLTQEAFEVERGVVSNEIAQRDEQGQVTAIQAHLFGALYPQGHPYHRAIGGTEASIATLTLADAEAFVREHYLPRNVTLYVSGDLNLGASEQVLDASLPPELLQKPAGGPLTPPVRSAGTAPPVPALGSNDKLETLRVPAERPKLYIAWSLPGGYGPTRYLERFARTAFSTASLGAATPGSDIEALSTVLIEGQQSNTLVSVVSLKEGKNPERSLERVLDQLATLWMPGESNAGEVQAANRGFVRMQKEAIVSFALQTETIMARALDKATIIHWTGDPRAWGKDLRAIYELSSSKMEAFAYEWLSRGRARAIFVEPNGQRTFEGAGTPAVFAASDDVHLTLPPQALRTYVHGPAGEVKTFALNNGLQVYVVQRKAAPTVAVTLGLLGGTATSEPLGAAELATVIARPTQTDNGPPSKFGARLALKPTADAVFYTGVAASGNVENLFAMMSDGVKSLRVDSSANGNWNQLVDVYRRADATSSSQAERAFRRQMFSGSPLGRSTTAPDVERLNGGEVQTWIDRSFRPKNAILAVVGEIDYAETEKQVRNWFESWQGEQDPRAQAPPGHLTDADGPVPVVRIDRAGSPQTDLRLGCSVLANSPTDRIALRLLAARLRERLWTLARTSLGGTYGFSGTATFHRQASGLEVEGNVEDRVLGSVLALARKQLDELGTVKMTPEELEQLKWRQGIVSNVHYGSNAQLAIGLVATGLAGLPVDFITNYPELLAAVTAEDVTRVAAACRKTAVLLLTGDPTVVSQAVQPPTH